MRVLALDEYYVVLLSCPYRKHTESIFLTSRDQVVKALVSMHLLETIQLLAAIGLKYLFVLRKLGKHSSDFSFRLGHRDFTEK